MVTPTFDIVRDDLLYDYINLENNDCERGDDVGEDGVDLWLVLLRMYLRSLHILVGMSCREMLVVVMKWKLG